jgi:hypothetical protein
MFHVPSVFIALQVIGSLCPKSLKSVVEDLNMGSFVHGRKAQRKKCRHGPSERFVMLVTSERNFPLWGENQHGAAVMLALTMDFD